MENKSEMMEAIMMGNENNMRRLIDLTSDFYFNVYRMLGSYIGTICNRINCIENAETSWNDIEEERIKSENAKVVEDTEKIVEIGQLLDKLKKLLEEE